MHPDVFLFLRLRVRSSYTASQICCASMVHCHSKNFVVLNGLKISSPYWAIDSCSNMFKFVPLISDVFIVSRRLNKLKTVATFFAVQDFGKKWEKHKAKTVKCRLYSTIEGSLRLKA